MWTSSFLLVKCRTDIAYQGFKSNFMQENIDTSKTSTRFYEK